MSARGVIRLARALRADHAGQRDRRARGCPNPIWPDLQGCAQRHRALAAGQAAAFAGQASQAITLRQIVEAIKARSLNTCLEAGAASLRSGVHLRALPVLQRA